MSSEHPNLMLNGDLLDYSYDATHLGPVIGNNSCEKNFAKAASDIISRVNVLCTHSSFVNINLLRYLYKSLCTAYYGCPLWKLSGTSLDSFVTCWKKSIRHLFKLSNRTRSRLIPYIIGSADIQTQLLTRFSSFWIKCCTSSNEILKICTQVCESGFSVVDCNLREVMSSLHIDYIDLETFVLDDSLSQRISEKFVNDMTNDDYTQATAILELCEIRDGRLTSNFSKIELEEFLLLLCTT